MREGGIIEHLYYSPIYIGNYPDGDWNESYELHDYIGGYIMGGMNPTWYLHPDTENRVYKNLDQWDGPI